MEQGHSSALRSLDQKIAVSQLLVEIALIAKDYGARFDLSARVLTEAVRFILKKFGKLGLAEIREAYREHAAGELKVQGAEMYGGEFNVATMGKILSAYCESRSKILAELLKQKEELKEQKEIAALHELKQAEFERLFPLEILSKRKEIKHYSEVPVNWFNQIYQRGWITFEAGEAVNFFIAAKALAKIEFTKIKKQSIQLSMKERFQLQSQNEEELAKKIAWQISVFEKVIKNKDWKPQ